MVSRPTLLVPIIAMWLLIRGFVFYNVLIVVFRFVVSVVWRLGMLVGIGSAVLVGMLNMF